MAAMGMGGRGTVRPLSQKTEPRLARSGEAMRLTSSYPVGLSLMSAGPRSGSLKMRNGPKLQGREFKRGISAENSQFRVEIHSRSGHEDLT
eukprot:6195427-Pleurochrysis_carterae.AAC.1